MQDKPKTARIGTTLFLDNPLHRQAWEILQTELQSSSHPQTISRPQPAGSVDNDVLGFLRALQEEGEES